MAYRVVDSEFNRANYASIIGKTYDAPPPYAQVVEVKGPGECGEVASGVFRVYATSEALTTGWDRIPPDMRAEYLGKIEKRIEKLVNDKKVTTETSKDVLDTLRTLKQVNEGTAQISLSPEDKLMPRIVKMAVSSIGECVCGTKTEIIQNKPPTRDTVKVDVWEERDRLIISIEDKESGNSYATWVDEDARQMFEDGFFKPGRYLEDSVLTYAEEMGILTK
ncbi:MAG: hypothetical protein Q8O55_07660 [Dehalococcoidales bacterium]|nr:hypothetical protein [Dehalococcoidales bacterium]